MWWIFLIPIFLIVIVVALIILIAKKQLYFPPEENINVIDKDKLLDKILKLDKNVFDVMQDKGGFKIKWTIVDAKWLGIVGKNWENVSYTAKGSFDKEKNVVNLFEKVSRQRKVNGMEARSYSYTTSGPLINTKMKVKQYGIKQNGEIGEVINFKFSPNEIKSVLKQVINNAGWGLQIKFL